jgi:hypothetical protein
VHTAGNVVTECITAPAFYLPRRCVVTWEDS